MMDTAKVYYSIDGEPRSIMQMVREDPYWAANRVQEGEKAIAELIRLRAENAELKSSLNELADELEQEHELRIRAALRGEGE